MFLLTPKGQRFLPFLRRALPAVHLRTAAQAASQRLAILVLPSGALALQALAGRLGDAELTLLALPLGAGTASFCAQTLRHGFYLS